MIFLNCLCNNVVDTVCQAECLASSCGILYFGATCKGAGGTHTRTGDKFIEYTSLTVFDAVDGQYTSVSGAVSFGRVNHGHYNLNI